MSLLWQSVIFTQDSHIYPAYPDVSCSTQKEDVNDGDGKIVMMTGIHLLPPPSLHPSSFFPSTHPRARMAWGLAHTLALQRVTVTCVARQIRLPCKLG